MHTPFGDLPDHWVQHSSMAEQHDHLRARLGRRTFLKGIAVAGLTAASPVLWQQPARATGTAGVSRHVGFGADPRHEAVVSFAAPGPFRRALVEYGVDDTFGTTVPVDVRSVAGVRTSYGHGLLAGLTPGTDYRYRVRLDGTVTRTGTLRTAPEQPEPFTFTAFGDQGVSRPAGSVIDQMRRLRPRFHLLAGDLCYADSSGGGSPSDHFDPRVWDSWLSMIDPVAASTAWMCATGNHDMEPGYGPQGYSGYLSRFVVPGNGAPGCAATYSFRYGNVGFVCLDSNDVSYEIPHNLGYSGGAQTAWLERQLAEFRAPHSRLDFVVVFFHHCAFGTSALHGSEGGVREHWVPLFDRYEVDLVISGHAHLYERTSQLRHGRITGVAPRSARVEAAAGTTYVTAGGGGAPFHGGFAAAKSFISRRGWVRQPEEAPWSLGTRSIKHSFLVIDVTPAGHPGRPAAMALRALDENGALLDEVTLLREATTGSAPPAASTGAGAALPWAAGVGAAVAATASGAALLRRAAAGRGRDPSDAADPA